MQLLAAHLYYRALLCVPSLIRSWWLQCKDKQLSSIVATYTGLHFSSAIITNELYPIKNLDPSSELKEENWAVKVSTALNEVSLAFTVDEQQMEIVVKLPTDFPLHGVEVRDVRRVGVAENKWRAWIFGVQQVVSSQVHLLDFKLPTI